MKGKISIILSSFCLATIGVFIKLIGESVPIMTTSFFRVFFAVLFLAALLPFIDHKVFHIKRKDIKHYVIIGLLMAVTMAFFNAAMLYTYISNVAIISTITPFVVLLLSFIFLKEKITKANIIIIIVSAVAIFLINPVSGRGSLMGNIFALVSQICYSSMLTYMRYEDRKHTLGVTFWYLLFAAIFLSPFPFIYGLGDIGSKWIHLLLIGFLSTAMAYVFLTYSLERLEAGVSSIFNAIFIPLFAIILAILIFKEILIPTMIIGGILLIASGVYMEVRKLKEST